MYEAQTQSETLLQKKCIISEEMILKFSLFPNCIRKLKKKTHKYRIQQVTQIKNSQVWNYKLWDHTTFQAVISNQKKIRNFTTLY